MNKDFIIKNQSLCAAIFFSILFSIGFLLFNVDVLYICLFVTLMASCFSFIKFTLRKPHNENGGKYFKNEKYDHILELFAFPMSAIVFGIYGMYINPTGDNSILNYFYYLYMLPTLKAVVLFILEIKQKKKGINGLSTIHGCNSGYYFFIGGLSSLSFLMLGEYWYIFILMLGNVLEELLIYIYKDGKEKEPNNNGIINFSLGYYFDTRIQKMNDLGLQKLP